MAFDPDAYLASLDQGQHTAGRGGESFDPDAWLAANGGATPDVSKLESFGRGALAGATFDFDDEVGGFLKSVLGDRSYSEYRDELRAKKAAAEEANPWTYRGGSVAGGLASTLVPAGAIGRAAKGVQTLGQAVRAGAASGAAGGALQALGASEADLTKGDVAGAIADTATGAATGAVLGGALGGAANKLVGGAGKRAVGDLQEDVISGANGVKARLKYQQQLAGLAGKRGSRAANTETERVLADLARDADNTDIVEVLSKNKAIRKALPDTEKARKLIGSRVEELSTVAPSAYREIDKEVGGMPLKYIVEPLQAKIEELASQPTNGLLRKELEGRLDDVLDAWSVKLKPKDVTKLIQDVVDGEIDDAAIATRGLSGVVATIREKLTPEMAEAIRKNPTAVDEVAKGLTTGGRFYDADRMIPTHDVRKWVTDVQTKASTTLGSIDQTTRAPIMQETAGFAKSILDEHLGNVVRGNPDLAPAVKKILDSNRELSMLLAMDRALENRAVKEASKGKGLAETISKGIKGPTAIAGALMTGNPAALIAPYVAEPALRMGARAASRTAKSVNFALAQLAKASEEGNVNASMVRAAIEVGAPLAAVRAALSLRPRDRAQSDAALAEAMSSAVEGVGEP